MTEFSHISVRWAFVLSLSLLTVYPAGGTSGAGPADLAALREYRRAPATRMVEIAVSGERPVELILSERRALNRGRGRFVYTGTISGDPASSVIVADVNGAFAAAVIKSTGERYELHRSRSGNYALHRADSSPPLPCAVPQFTGADQVSREETRAAAAGDEASPPAAVTSGNGSVIDILVVYTDDARAAAGSASALEAAVLVAVEEGNTAFERSNIDAELRLVHIAEVAYTETGNPNTDVTRLRNTADGYIDIVHAWRDDYGADLVAMVVETMTGFCGLAFVMDELSPAFAQDAFSVTRRDCISGYTLIHELGHNLGCDHTRDDPSLKRLFPYSYAHRFTVPSGTNRTIMARGTGTRILNYSNPDVTVEGTATGVPSAQTNAAHNAATIQASRATAAAFRAEKV